MMALRKSYEVTGCATDGATYCPGHCPEPGTCEEAHGAIFLSSEVDCFPDHCDVCGAEIEESVIHTFERSGHCRYCGISCEHRFGSVDYARMTGNPHRTCLDCGVVSLDMDDD